MKIHAIEDANRYNINHYKVNFLMSKHSEYCASMTGITLSKKLDFKRNDFNKARRLFFLEDLGKKQGAKEKSTQPVSAFS